MLRLQHPIGCRAAARKPVPGKEEEENGREAVANVLQNNEHLLMKKKKRMRGRRQAKQRLASIAKGKNRKTGEPDENKSGRRKEQKGFLFPGRGWLGGGGC